MRLEDLTFDELDERVAVLKEYLESVKDDSTEYEKTDRYIRALSMVKMDMCDREGENIRRLYESGEIDANYASEMFESMEQTKEEAMQEAFPYLESATATFLLSIAIEEVRDLIKILFDLKKTKRYIIDKTLGSSIRHRLKRYNIIHQDAVQFELLKSKKYALPEIMDNKLGKQFKLANKWMKDGEKTHVKIYYYNGKPVCGIAWLSNGSVETVFYDSKFKRHEDYYNASMCVKVYINHPSIKRTMTQLKDDWARELKKQRQSIEESANKDASQGNLKRKLKLMEESVADGFLDEEMYNLYVKEVNQSLNY